MQVGMLIRAMTCRKAMSHMNACRQCSRPRLQHTSRLSRRLKEVTYTALKRELHSLA